MNKLIGFQVADKNGINIQGDDNDPSGFSSWMIMLPDTAINFVDNNTDFLLQPIYEGMIEDYELV